MNQILVMPRTIGAALVLTAVLANARVWAQPRSDTPLPTPLYSIDAASPSTSATVPANAVLAKPGPHIRYPGSLFGLNNAADEIDGLSGAYTFENTQPFLVLFCVDRASTGGTSPDPALAAANRPFNVQDQAAKHQAAGDIFMSTSAFTRTGPAPFAQIRVSSNNTLVTNQGDAGGNDLDLTPNSAPEEALPPVTPIDAVDGIGYEGYSASLEEGIPNSILFFSASKNSPSLSTLPGMPSGAAIYGVHTDQPGAIFQYAQAQQLGLQSGTNGDDIDDFIVFDNGNGIFNPGADQIVFTLTRGSPSLAGASGANVYTSNGTGGFTLLIPAASLGLSNTDNISGLDLVTTDDPDTDILKFAIQQRIPGDHDGNGILDQSDCDGFLSCFQGSGVPYDTDGVATINVSISPSHFNPPVATIEVGDTVRWMWTGGTHNVVSGNTPISDGMFFSGPPTSVVGTTYQVPFTYALLDVYPRSEWIYPYFCQAHPTGTGSIHVLPDPCAVYDLDFDGDVDCADWIKFRTIYSQYNPAGMCTPLAIPEFVAVLLGTPLLPVHVCLADMNLDGKADGRDVSPYVHALVP